MPDLRPYQERTVDWLQHHPRSILGTSPGLGKMLPLDTPVPTPTGWSTIGDIRVGDTIFDGDGVPTRVRALYPVDATPESYEIEFSDGTRQRCCADHLWSCNTIRGRRTKRPPVVLTTREMVDRVRYTDSTAPMGFKANLSVAVAGPLQIPERDVPIDPYVLGVWLGDGGCTTAVVTFPDEEIVQGIRDAGYGVTTNRPANRCPSHYIRGLIGQLRALGLLGNKRIPKQYLRASEHQRWQLLAGLMDTDGTTDQATPKNGKARHSGTTYYTTSSQDLANDVYELICSLGMQANISRPHVGKYRAKDGSMRICKDSYRISFRSLRCPYRLKRKAERFWPARESTVCYRYIWSITPCEPVPMRCLEVESASHLFLVGRAMIPTHNTACVLRSLQDGPAIAVCALRDAMWTWEREIDLWLPGATRTTYFGTQAQRAKIPLGTTDFLITTPRMLPEIMARVPRWRSFLIDEAQYVKGRKTQVFKTFTQMRAEDFRWISGSPMVTTPADLWPPLHLIDRRKFSSYWRWVNDNCIVVNDGFGNRIIGVINAERTRRELEPYYYAVLKSEVEDQLPPKNRYPIYTELTPQQRKLYTELEKDMIGRLQGGELLLAPNMLSVGTRLRQVLISPELLPGWEGEAESGALSLLHDKVEGDFDDGRAVAIFTPFAQAMPIIARHLPSCEVFYFRGGQSNRQAIADFQAFEGRKALIGTIRSAASFNAYSATVGYFLGYEWTPAANVQAEDRLHRIGQTKSVDIRYVVNRETIDEHLMDVLNMRTGWNEALL